jgi:hypothetical protein
MYLEQEVAEEAECCMNAVLLPLRPPVELIRLRVLRVSVVK